MRRLRLLVLITMDLVMDKHMCKNITMDINKMLKGMVMVMDLGKGIAMAMTTMLKIMRFSKINMQPLTKIKGKLIINYWSN